MKILNFGSLNIDHVYHVPHFVRPGETLNSNSYTQFCGGKGLNQSIALSYAGAEVYHAGKIGKDGMILLNKLNECGVNTEFIEILDTDATGHAIIQVNPQGENCIILHAGTNHKINDSDIHKALSHFSEGDYILLQNEINNIPLIMNLAKEKGLKIAFNPAPMDKSVLRYPLDLVDIFIVNEIEGKELTNEIDTDAILYHMLTKYPQAASVLTLGAKGVCYRDNNQHFTVPAYSNVKVVDTTAAGDTFIGYYLSHFTSGVDVYNSLKIACKASAICVSRLGASDSIPKKDEII